MRKLKILAVAMLMLAGIGAVGFEMTAVAAPYPTCGGCWPD